MRYVGIFFGMLTLAFGMLFHSFLFKFYHLTGGDSGMRVPRMSILGLEFAQYNKIEFLAGPFYYYCLGLLIIAGFVMWRIVHSPFGLHLKTIRDNARKAEYLGVHVHRFRLAAFVISAGFGAVGGAILGFRVGLADPELVYWTQSGQLVFMAVLGGFSNFFGPIVGALTFTLLQDQLQSLTQYWRFILGAILALIVIGISGRHCRIGRRPAASDRGEDGMTVLLETRNVSKSYGAFRALEHVSMAVHQGELVSVVGPNGAGKTTLGQSAHRAARADRRRGPVHGQEYRRRRTGRARRSWPGARVSAHPDFSAADGRRRRSQPRSSRGRGSAGACSRGLPPTAR